MKVRLTQNGKPFGRLMHRDIAFIYIEQTRHVLQGIHYEWVKP